MGTILASAILTKAKTIVQDSTGVRWQTSELLGWLNDGQRAVVSLKPDASVKNIAVALTVGSKQTIPADGIVMIDVVRNMGSGSTPGAAIRKIQRHVLDEQIPDWHTSAKASAVTLYAMFDPRNQKTYYIYPPAASATQIEIVYSCVPVDVATEASTITIDDIYAGPLLDFVLYRAYSKDAEYAGNDGRAAASYAAFLQTLGGKEKAEQENEAPSSSAQMR
jgi:hypothetical protein